MKIQWVFFIVSEFMEGYAYRGEDIAQMHWLWIVWGSCAELIQLTLRLARAILHYFHVQFLFPGKSVQLMNCDYDLKRDTNYRRKTCVNYLLYCVATESAGSALFFFIVNFIHVILASNKHIGLEYT